MKSQHAKGSPRVPPSYVSHFFCDLALPSRAHLVHLCHVLTVGPGHQQVHLLPQHNARPQM